ncbi:hypothetical protein ACVH9Z_26970 [Rhodococcus opacus]|uniref:hypothetical protein n=1 Tax=Rhodococcus opacus TaxID=37919 RepID=UPI00146DC6BE|nr:hypothetical protein [Rhodococcus opacus]MDJ0420132.1 hypothetical protein [Rhodococcus opacus]
MTTTGPVIVTPDADEWPGRGPFVCITNVPTMAGARDDDDDAGSLVGRVTVRSFIGIDG